MIPTRRTLLSGGLAAAAWGLSARAQVPALAVDGFLPFEVSPSRLRLAPSPADPASTLSYAGATPGPLLRLKKGEELKLRLVNKLAEPTALSFPGLRAANASAGYGGLTQPRLQPGASADIRFSPPDSGFNLYLPHAGATDAGQQGRGLFGPIIVEEANKVDADQDVAIVLSDWSLDERGQIKDDFGDPALARGPGRKGGLVFANGEAAPLRVSARPGARIRLRLGNAATARLTNVGIDGARTFIVAVDGQPSEPFEPLRNQFPMGPGARFELMVDMPRASGASVRLALKGDAGAPDQAFVTIVTDGEPVPERGAAPGLAANPLLPAEIALEASRRYDFTVSGGGAAPFALNGVTFVDWSPKPAFVIPRGAPSVFAIANKTAVVQAMRLGGHVARLLHSMDDGWEPYWRDTILIQPGRTAHVAFVADNPGKWPIESAIPEHRAAGVGGWFQVG
ncbi:multicopper oxidase family protein [Roseiarcus sp.]|uniref:multicopper oxidase family protein n=2 Tax=Roseiarcus sp. TaxID=1969460 RepID=UPI003C5E085D